MRTSLQSNNNVRHPNGHLLPGPLQDFANTQKERLADYGFATAKDGFKDLYDFKPEMKTYQFNQL